MASVCWLWPFRADQIYFPFRGNWQVVVEMRSASLAKIAAAISRNTHPVRRAETRGETSSRRKAADEATALSVEKTNEGPGCWRMRAYEAGWLISLTMTAFAAGVPVGSGQNAALRSP